LKEKNIFKEYKMEVAIDNVIEQIAQEINKYIRTKDKNSIKELAVLIRDRDRIYNNNEETINKYVKMRRLD